MEMGKRAYGAVLISLFICAAIFPFVTHAQSSVAPEIQAIEKATVIGVANEHSSLIPGTNTNESIQTLTTQILDGTDPDLTNGADFYANETTATSGWYKVHIVESGLYPVTAVIGRQTFRKHV